MPALTAGELNLLRGGSQHSDLYMVVQQPEYRQHGEWTGYEWSGVVVAAHVVPIAGITAIYGFEVTSDGGATLYDGMTVLISHVERGEWDLGIVRLHGDQTIGAGAEDIWVAPSSDLSTVAAGDFIVVLDEFKVWSRYPWVEEAAGALTWYKDYGYFRQVLAADGLTWAQLAGAEACLPPAAIMGPHAVAFIESRAGASVDIDFNWSDTYHNYPGVAVDDWDAWGEDGGAGWNVLTTENPPAQTYTNVSGLGGYRVRLEIRRAAGSNPPVEYRRGIRYVFTLRRPGETMAGDPPNAEPITDFQVMGMSGSFASGRWRASIRIYGDQAHEYLILPGALVILFAEDWYGGAKRSIGPLDKSTTSPLKNRENIVLIGRIADGTIRQDSETGDISFDILSAAELATKRENYPVPIENNDVPSEWYEAPDLTVGRAAWHYACWHTTLPLVCDFYNIAEPDAPVGNDYEVAAQDFLEGNMYATIDTFLQNRLVGRLLCDRYERFNCVIDRQVQASAGGVTVFSLQDGDRLGASQIREVEELPVSIVDIGGVFYDAGVIIPLMSHAPGEVSKYWGTPEQSTSLALGAPGDAEAAVQAILNTLSGRLLAYRNNEYPTLSLNQGNWRAMDIWPQEYVSVTLVTERHTFTNDLFIAREFSYAFQPAEGALTVTTVLEKETDGPPGVTVVIPDEIPDLPRKPIEWPPWEPPGPGGFVDTGRRIISCDKGVFVTDEIADAVPFWYAVNTGVPVARLRCWKVIRDPWHWWTSGGTEKTLWGIFSDPAAPLSRPRYIYKHENFPDGAWALSLDSDTLLNGVPAFVFATAHDICGTIEVEDWIYVMGVACQGADSQQGYLLRTVDGGTNWTRVTGQINPITVWGLSIWPRVVWTIDTGKHSAAQAIRMTHSMMQAGNPGITIRASANGGGGWGTLQPNDGFGADVFCKGLTPYHSATWDDSYLYTLVELAGAGAEALQVSTDTGASWTDIATFKDANMRVVAFAEYTWDHDVLAVLVSGNMAWNPAYIYYTDNAGATWTQWKSLGNMQTGWGALFDFNDDGTLRSVLYWNRTLNQMMLATADAHVNKTGNLVAVTGGINDVTTIDRDTLGSA